MSRMAPPLTSTWVAPASAEGSHHTGAILLMLPWRWRPELRHAPPPSCASILLTLSSFVSAGTAHGGPQGATLGRWARWSARLSCAAACLRRSRAMEFRPPAAGTRVERRTRRASRCRNQT